MPGYRPGYWETLTDDEKQLWTVTYEHWVTQGWSDDTAYRQAYALVWKRRQKKGTP